MTRTAIIVLAAALFSGTFITSTHADDGITLLGQQSGTAQGTTSGGTVDSNTNDAARQALLEQQARENQGR